MSTSFISFYLQWIMWICSIGLYEVNVWYLKIYIVKFVGYFKFNVLAMKFLISKSDILDLTSWSISIYMYVN